MQWVGKPDLGYSLATLLICAIGGLPGVLVLGSPEYFWHNDLKKRPASP